MNPLGAIKTLAVSLSVLLLAACGPAQTATSIAVAPTTSATVAASDTSTVTLMTTPTPTSTNTPTSTPTHTSTPTTTNTPTATPTPTDKPQSVLSPTKARPSATPALTVTPRPRQVVFQDDFESGAFRIGERGWGRDGWNENILADGTRVEIRSAQAVFSDLKNWVDSNGNSRGNVMVVTIEGAPVPKPDWGSNELWRVGYPQWVYAFPEDSANPIHSLERPAGVQVDVWTTPNIGGVSLLSVHIKNSEAMGNDSVVAFSIHENDKLKFIVRDAKGRQTDVWIEPGLWKVGEFNTLGFVIEQDGRTIPYVNGFLGISNPAKAPKLAHIQGAFFDAHCGVNRSSPGGKDGLAQGAIVVNDNFVVFATSP